jgi:hypothetical protein
MKRMTLLILFVLVLLALAGLIIKINIKEVVVKSQENLAFQYISDIKNTTQDLKFLSQNGITLENTSKYAKVTPSQAVKIASQVIPLGPVEKAKKIVVEYCQIKSYKFTYPNNAPTIDTSCYLVSFEGIARYTELGTTRPMNSRITSSSELVPVGYEYNIIVDANSGKILGEFNYR